MSTASTLTAPKKGLYDWHSQDHSPECAKLREAFDKAHVGKTPTRAFACRNDALCCPDDLVVNAGSGPIIIGAAASVPEDSPRLDMGDRRSGPYYVKLLGLHGMTGLQRVKLVSMKRLGELEKVRKQRTGEMPADWIVEARQKAAKGGGAVPLDNPREALTPLQKAALGMAPD